MSVDVRITAGVMVITLNRPEAANALNPAIGAGLVSALTTAAGDPEVRTVIVTGAGEKIFCAGMDLKAFAAGEAGDIMGARGGFGGIAQRDFPKPMIAALNGSALAGGCEIMLSCDLVVAVVGAMIGIPEVKRGLLAGAGGLFRLPKRIPRAIALELALTGDPIDAQRALAIGLINRVVPAAELMTAALALAGTIAENAPLAVRGSKKVMLEAGEVPDAEGWAISNAALPPVFSSSDAMEGAVAFAEKRKPVWTGK